MQDSPPTTKGRARRVRKNLRLGMALAWAASPRSLVRYSILGMLSAAMPPIAVYLGATLVNRIAEARLHSLQLSDLVPILLGLWLATAVQRAVGAYMGYGRNLFVRRVQLEAERRLLPRRPKSISDISIIPTGTIVWRAPSAMFPGGLATSPGPCWASQGTS